MTVREATSADLPTILAITNHEIATNVAHFGTQPVPLAELTHDFESAQGRYPWLVAVDDAAPTFTPTPTTIGFAKAGPWKSRGAYAWATEIGVYVAPAHQRRGVGRALYTDLFPRLKAAGLRCILAGIALPNPGSVRLHESFGMRHVGTLERVGYKHGAWHDVGYWQLLYGELNQPPERRLI